MSYAAECGKTVPLLAGRDTFVGTTQRSCIGADPRNGREECLPNLVFNRYQLLPVRVEKANINNSIVSVRPTAG